MALKKAGGLFWGYNLSPFASDSSSQLNVLWHNSDTFGVDGTQIGVFEETDQIGLARLLKCSHGRALESKVGLKVLRDLSDQSLERQSSN